jgi:hypothetical protein
MDIRAGAEERPAVVDMAYWTANPTSPARCDCVKALKKRGWTYVGPTTMYARLCRRRAWSTITWKAAPAGPHRSVAPPLQTPHLKRCIIVGVFLGLKSDHVGASLLAKNPLLDYLKVLRYR